MMYPNWFPSAGPVFTAPWHGLRRVVEAIGARLRSTLTRIVQSTVVRVVRMVIVAPSP